MYYVYILQSIKDKKLYIGFTANLRRRFKEHQKGNSKSTKIRRPFRLIYYEAHLSKKDAQKKRTVFQKRKRKVHSQTDVKMRFE